MSIAYSVLILLLVTLPINGEDQVLGQLNDNYVLQIRYDYISHTLLFIPWTMLVWWSWNLRLKSSNGRMAWFAASLGFAAFCEYIQLPLTYRTFNVNDLMANLLGVLLGFLVVWKWPWIKAGPQPDLIND